MIQVTFQATAGPVVLYCNALLKAGGGYYITVGGEHNGTQISLRELLSVHSFTQPRTRKPRK